MRRVFISVVLCLLVFNVQASSFLRVKTIVHGKPLAGNATRSIEVGIRHIYNDFRNLFKLTYRNAPRVKNEIFATKKDYLKFAERFNILVPDHSGFYSSRTNSAYTWNHKDPKKLMAIVMHESVHRLVARNFRQAPTWLNEGLATYYAEIQVERGKLVVHPADFRDRRVKKYLKVRGDFDVNKFIHDDFRAFYRGGDDSYAMSWSIVSFMMSNNAGRQLLSGIYKGVQGKSFRRKSIADIFNQNYPRGIEGFKTNWKAWALKKRVPVKVTMYY